MKTLILAAVAATMLSGTAFAAVVSGSDACGPLPNAKWSWAVTTETVVTGGGISTSESTDVNYVGNKNGTNGFETTTTTTTVAPTYEQKNTICTAINPAGKPVEDKTYSIAGELVETVPGSETSTTSDPLKICGPNLM